ncbi:MAG: hypothetical protein IPG71_08885 [bacterium]|nr:hypothetical protein [bacterium]
MKKLLPTIGLYAGTFIVLNVAMFFLLKMTQPAPSPSELALGQDSTGHDSTHAELVDSLSVGSHATEHTQEAELAHGDSVEPPVADTTAVDPHQMDTAANDQAHDTAVVEADVEQPLVESPVRSAEVDSASLEDPPDEVNDGAEIAKLAKVLEGMKPAEAAVIAERLPTDTIVELVMRMKARTGAKMMASLPVPVAANVATRMAELSGAKKSS